MKKALIISLSSLVFVFIVITYTKQRGKENTIQEEIGQGARETEDLQKFWNIYRKATSLRIDGKWTEAIGYYQKAIAINPVHEDALYYLGNMFLETGNDKQAEITWLRLIDINPKSSRAHFQLGNLYMNSEFEDLHDLSRAKQEFEITFEINKDFIQPLVHLGEIELYNGNIDKASGYFTTVLGSDYKNVPSNYLLGYVYWKKDNKAKALASFTNACKNSVPAKAREGVSNEGDTREGKSLERNINRSIFHSYFIDLSGLPESSLSSEMTLSYQKLDSFLVK